MMKLFVFTCRQFRFIVMAPDSKSATDLLEESLYKTLMPPIEKWRLEGELEKFNKSGYVFVDSNTSNNT